MANERYKLKLRPLSKDEAENVKRLIGRDLDPDIKPNWSRKCENCGATPIVPITGMCGPCTFGEADTADGNW